MERNPAPIDEMVCSDLADDTEQGNPRRVTGRGSDHLDPASPDIRRVEHLQFGIVEGSGIRSQADDRPRIAIDPNAGR